MTTPTPTPEKQNVSEPGDSEETTPTPANGTSPEATGFFHRVQRELKPEIHPSEAAEIVIMDEGDGDR
jgi:hypothetical protein